MKVVKLTVRETKQHELRLMITKNYTGCHVMLDKYQSVCYSARKNVLYLNTFDKAHHSVLYQSEGTSTQYKYYCVSYLISELTDFPELTTNYIRPKKR